MPRRRNSSAPASFVWRPATSPGVPTLRPAQLGWLLAVIAGCVAPQLGSLESWVLGGLLLAAVWRSAAVLRGWPLPGTWLRGGLTIAAAAAVAVQYHSIAGLDAGSALLILMLALKLLETTGSRDRAVVVLIAWFVLFAGFLREQSLLSIGYLALGLGTGLWALLEANRSTATLPVAAGAGALGRLMLHGLPLALALFLLFPRLPGPFWAMPAPGGAGRTGLSEEMSPGDISSLAQSDEIAFRARFSSGTPQPADLYWRGPVLDRFDGRRWRGSGNTAPGRTLPPRFEPDRRYFAYEIVLEPHDGTWLLPLDAPVDWDLVGASLSNALELQSARGVDRRLAYRARSQGGGVFRPAEPPTPATLGVPRQRNPRTQALAAELRRAHPDDRGLLLAILARFRAEPFYYTLQPPLLGADPVDDFLFRTRAGFCEHYAAAFTVLVRAAGLPARVVTGYLGGEWNPIAGHWVVRQSDAHAWAEVWTGGRWVRFDPTGAVAPERIEGGIEAALPETAGSGLPILGGQRLLDAVALRWDALNAGWDRLVLAFGAEEQAGLLARAGWPAATLRDVALACAGMTALVLLGFTVFRIGRPRRQRDPLGEAWGELSARLARPARSRWPAEGPEEYARAVGALRPDLASAVSALVGQYVRLRYERVAGQDDVAAFRRAVRTFRPR